jgi:hypothetical protein
MADAPKVLSKNGQKMPILQSFGKTGFGSGLPEIKLFEGESI